MRWWLAVTAAVVVIAAVTAILALTLGHAPAAHPAAYGPTWPCRPWVHLGPGRWTIRHGRIWNNMIPGTCPPHLWVWASQARHLLPATLRLR